MVQPETSSANFQMSYNFGPPDASTFHMRYQIPSEAIPFTASALIERPGETVRCHPAGAAPGHHQVSFNLTGAAPDFMVLFTFS